MGSDGCIRLNEIHFMLEDDSCVFFRKVETINALEAKDLVEVVRDKNSVVEGWWSMNEILQCEI